MHEMMMENVHPQYIEEVAEIVSVYIATPHKMQISQSLYIEEVAQIVQVSTQQHLTRGNVPERLAPARLL